MQDYYEQESPKGLVIYQFCFISVLLAGHLFFELHANMFEMLTKWPQLKNLHTVSAHSGIQMCVWFIPLGVPDCRGLAV